MLTMVSSDSAMLLASDRMVAPMATGASSSSTNGIDQAAGKIEQHGELQDVEGEEDRGLAVVDARRGRPSQADREIEQGRQCDRAAHRQHRQGEAQTPMDDGGGEELAGDGGPADQHQRAQAHAAAQRQGGARR